MVEENLKHLDELGGPNSYNHYCSGWAWAFDTPFPYWKRWAGYEGGIADICLLAWPKRIAARGEMRHHYTHAIGIVPTLYELLGITPPDVIHGYQQSEIEGESFAPSLTDPSAPEKETQFYAMLGQRAIYHQGWLACTLHPPISGWSHFDHDGWELYNLRKDRGQMNNLAGQYPERVDQLKTLWFYLASRYQGLPLDDRTPLEILSDPTRVGAKPRSRYRYYPDCAPVPEQVAANIRGRSYTIAAATVVDHADAQGVLFAQGSNAGGHCLYVKDGRLVYLYNWLGEALQKTTSDAPITPGRHVFTAEFQRTGQDPQTKSALGTLTLYIDAQPVGHTEIKTQPGFFGLSGEGLSVGRNTGAAISPDYQAPFAFIGGTVEGVVIDVSGDTYVDHEKEVRAWLTRD
jgi:arylsulfatase